MPHTLVSPELIASQRGALRTTYAGLIACLQYRIYSEELQVYKVAEIEKQHRKWLIEAVGF